MSATYILSNNASNYQNFIIPQADIITGNYFLNTNLAANEFWILTFATLRLINSTTPYTGFTDISLRQSGGSYQGIIETSILPNAGTIESNYILTFAYNVTTGPTLFGAYSSGPRYAIRFNGLYISGDGDFELNFYYQQIFV
jgi:hypothetical protein